jgi:hypothetical protein
MAVRLQRHASAGVTEEVGDVLGSHSIGCQERSGSVAQFVWRNSSDPGGIAQGAEPAAHIRRV